MNDERIYDTLVAIHSFAQDSYTLHSAMAKVEMMWMTLAAMMLGGILLAVLFNGRHR